jgi:3-oxoacyl-[acyl-carrier-protein] synthase-3
MKRVTATIMGIASHLPETVLSNEQLSEEFESWDEARVTAKTGILARRIASPGECASDLGVIAARKLFDSSISKAENVDFLLYCTQSPDYFLPTTACLLQDRLGLGTGCGAIDINQGCSGFVYGLAVAKGLVESGAARCVLLITADTYTRYVNRRDRGTRPIFGDGAAATLIGVAQAAHEIIGPFVLGTDGRGAKNLIVASGGLRNPLTIDTLREREDGNGRSDQYLYMNGAEVFAFALRVVPDAVGRLLNRSGLDMEDVDHFVFHQANTFMLERLRDKLKIPPEKFVIDMKDTGNTGSASIPIVLDRALGHGRIRPGDRVLLLGFGVGYSWAAAMVHFR